MCSVREADGWPLFAPGQPSLRHLRHDTLTHTPEPISLAITRLAAGISRSPPESAVTPLLERYRRMRSGLPVAARRAGSTRCPRRRRSECLGARAEARCAFRKRSGGHSLGYSGCAPLPRTQRHIEVLVRRRCAATPNRPRRDTAPSEPEDSLRTPSMQGTVPERPPGKLTSQLLRQTAPRTVLDSVRTSILGAAVEPSSTPDCAHFGWAIRGAQGGPKGLIEE